MKPATASKIEMGDTVEYNGQLWEVGFVNKRRFAGTLRLQESGEAGAKQVNWIEPSAVVLQQKRGITL